MSGETHAPRGAFQGSAINEHRSQRHRDHLVEEVIFSLEDAVAPPSRHTAGCVPIDLRSAVREEPFWA